MSDIKVDAPDGQVLVVEDKAIGGHFQPGQAESYAQLLVVNPRIRTLLVAPQGFLDAHPTEAQQFSATASLESIASVLNRENPTDTSELALSYAHRACEFRRLALGSARVGSIDAAVRAFSDLYRDLDAGLHAESLQPGTLSRPDQKQIEFVRWGDHANYAKPYHKFRDGHVDVAISAWRNHSSEFIQFVHQKNSRLQLPKGWTPASQQDNVYPVLRCDVQPIHDFADLDAARPVMEQTLHTLLDLREWWWDRGGFDLLARNAQERLAWHLDRAGLLAEQCGPNLSPVTLERMRLLAEAGRREERP